MVTGSPSCVRCSAWAYWPARACGGSDLMPLVARPRFHKIFAAVADGAGVNHFHAGPEVGIHAEGVARRVLDLDGDRAFDPVRLDLADPLHAAAGPLVDQFARRVR